MNQDVGIFQYRCHYYDIKSPIFPLCLPCEIIRQVLNFSTPELFSFAHDLLRPQGSKTTTLHVHHAFLHIFQPSLQHCDMKFPNFTRPLYGVGERNTKKFFFSFSKLRYGLFGFSPENFASIWQIKWNWMINEVWNSVKYIWNNSFWIAVVDESEEWSSQ